MKIKLSKLTYFIQIVIGSYTVQAEDNTLKQNSTEIQDELNLTRKHSYEVDLSLDDSNICTDSWSFKKHNEIVKTSLLESF